jgi:hypothetical protein
LSALQGRPMSSLISEMLSFANPIQKRVLEALRNAHKVEQEGREVLVSTLSRAEEQMTSQIEPLLQLLEAVSMGQPPHSNTGVTKDANSMAPTHDEHVSHGKTKKNRKKGPRGRTGVE